MDAFALALAAGLVFAADGAAPADSSPARAVPARPRPTASAPT